MARRSKDTFGVSDMEEGRPLIHQLRQEDKEILYEIEALGATENVKFNTAYQLSVRAAIFGCLLGLIIWVPEIRGPFPDDLQALIPLTVLLYFFTLSPILGGAVANCITAFVGTLFAVFHIWVMMGIFPGGVRPGMSPYGGVAIFGWINFVVVLWVVLWAKTSLGMKMWLLSYDLGFIMCFLNPNDSVTFSEGFAVNIQGAAVSSILATLMAIAACLLVNLLPYPLTSAFKDMRTASLSAANDTSRLFDAAAKYFCGGEASVVIDSETRHMNILRGDLDKMDASIGAAWFEGFDLGARGTVRALMEAHAALLRDVADRLRSMLIVCETEDFGESHRRIVEGIRNSSTRLTQVVRTLLLKVTAAASDGNISSSERDGLQALIRETRDAVASLSRDFDAARKPFARISNDTLNESFFVLTLSGYARLVCEYTELLINNPPKGSSFGQTFMNAITSTWKPADLMSAVNLNFAIKHFIAITICMLVSVYTLNWSGACVITSVFLISTSICPNVNATLNMMNAVVVACVVSSMLFDAGCETGYGFYLLPVISYFCWHWSMYAVFSGSAFGLVAIFVAGLTPLKLVGQCPDPAALDPNAAAAGTWGFIVGASLAIIIVSLTATALAYDRADRLSMRAIDDMFKGLKVAFGEFWACGDTKGAMGPVTGHLSDGASYNDSAKLEARFWRNEWRGSLYGEIVEGAHVLRLDILTLYRAAAGSDGKPDAIFRTCQQSEAFGKIKGDLSRTLEDTHGLILDVLHHEGARFPMSKIPYAQLRDIDILEDMPALIAAINRVPKLQPPSAGASSMEDDETCQLSTVILMLNQVVKHIAVLLRATIRDA